MGNHKERRTELRRLLARRPASVESERQRADNLAKLLREIDEAKRAAEDARRNPLQNADLKENHLTRINVKCACGRAGLARARQLALLARALRLPAPAAY